MSYEEVLAFVEQFVRRKHPDITVLTLETDLVAMRLLNSVDFLEFLLALEDLTGREISLDEVAPEDFRTVNAIHSRFFAHPTASPTTPNPVPTMERS
ncbi:hypothetical protein ACWEKT_08425 [Nocardia takedensis]